jgi:hypothetical protein
MIIKRVFILFLKNQENIGANNGFCINGNYKIFGVFPPPTTATDR